MPIVNSNSNTNSNAYATNSNAYAIRVLNVREIKDRPGCYRFSAEVNGVKIYGMQYITYTNKNGKLTSFVSFPSYKGSDGKFYNICYFPIENDSEEFKSIEKQLKQLILG